MTNVTVDPILGMIIAETFWSVSAVQIAMLAAMIGGFVTWFSRFEGRVRSAAEALKVLSKETEETFTDQRLLFNELVSRVTQMDREGTRKSQQSIAADEKLYEINTRRLDKLETITLDLAPKVAAMAVDVGWIAHQVRKNGSA